MLTPARRRCSPQVLEWIYLYIFTFELTMKIIAYGFIGHKHSYLRDAWCQLDFVVVSKPRSAGPENAPVAASPPRPPPPPCIGRRQRPGPSAEFTSTPAFASTPLFTHST